MFVCPKCEWTDITGLKTKKETFKVASKIYFLTSTNFNMYSKHCTQHTCIHKDTEHVFITIKTFTRQLKFQQKSNLCDTKINPVKPRTYYNNLVHYKQSPYSVFSHFWRDLSESGDLSS